MSYRSILIFSAHAADLTICLCAIFAITCTPLSGALWRKWRSCGVRMIWPACDRPFLAFLGSALHGGLCCSLPASWVVSLLSLLFCLLRPLLEANGTAGSVDDVARDPDYIFGADFWVCWVQDCWFLFAALVSSPERARDNSYLAREN